MNYLIVFIMNLAIILIPCIYLFVIYIFKKKKKRKLKIGHFLILLLWLL